MGNDKNCTLNIVGMFLVQNEVIWARFSTLSAPSLFRWCPDMEKSSKFGKKINELLDSICGAHLKVYSILQGT